MVNLLDWSAVRPIARITQATSQSGRSSRSAQNISAELCELPTRATR